MMLFWCEKDDDVILVGEERWYYTGGRRMAMLFWWETDDDVILVGEG